MSKDEKYMRKMQETKKLNIGTIDDPKYRNLAVTCLE